MNRILSTALVASLFAFGATAQAQDKELSQPSGQQKITPDTPMGKTHREREARLQGDTMQHNGKKMAGEMKHDNKMVDSNGDGMISKAEFMKHHETMWSSMKKDSKGMVSATDYQGMPMPMPMPMSK